MDEWEAMGKIERQEEVGNQLPTTQEQNGNDSGAEFLEVGGNGGVRIITGRSLKQMMKIWGTLSQEGAE